MQETAEQYTERLLRYQQGQEPLKTLASSPKKLARLLEGIPRRRLSARPAEGRWSAAEILAHLSDAEIAFAFRIRMILASSGTLIQAYDQNVWAAFSNYPKHDPALSLEAFRTLREKNVQLLKAIPKERWENYGMHEERGKEPLSRLVELTAGHDINHIMQIEQILGPTRTAPRTSRR